MVAPARLVAALEEARIGTTFNQYAEGPRAPLLRARLAAYLEARRTARTLLVGEAPGYRGARVSGIPFTSERQLTGTGPAEATATIVHRVLAELGLEEDVLLWNVVPTHPGTERSNRAPTPAEVAAGLRFLEPLAAGRSLVAVGRLAERALGPPSVCHPSHGGAKAFRSGLASVTSRADLQGERRVRLGTHPSGDPKHVPLMVASELVRFELLAGERDDELSSAQTPERGASPAAAALCAGSEAASPDAFVAYPSDPSGRGARRMVELRDHGCLAPGRA
ncbi:MAG TPA: uracil-DNA glycosylase [Gaiellaceae bacterium]|nr:uracil-DNA glycosylase [Gaiellaceae bacterium]